ncbi:MAG: hypothetical protein OEN50_08900 [Deltaproteobacteria bacterium]|nr:hypothetical protein [Deltaproteobacteria bacterium]
MKKFAMTLLAFVLFPTLVIGAELMGTVTKVDKEKNLIMLKTERGEEVLVINQDTKGLEHAKQGAKVTVELSEKDGSAKVNAIEAGK